MADQVEIQIPDVVWNEGSGFTATAYFRTRSSRTSSVPTTIHYRIDCLSTGSTVSDWALVSTPAGSKTISVTSSNNAIINGDKATELKQLTVQADRGLTTQSTGRVLYRVRNLAGVT